MRVVAIRADDLSFSHRHVRRTHQLRFALEMTLTAHFYFCSLGVEKSPVGSLRQLFATGLLHDRVAVDAGNATARVRACLPVSLYAPLMAAQTSFVLSFSRLTRVFAETDQAADAFAAAGRNMVASRTVTAFASPLLGFVARVEKKNFPHLGLGKFFELIGVAGFTNFVADIGGGSLFCRFRVRGPYPLRIAQQQTAQDYRAQR